MALNPDGKVIISTRLDNSQIPKGVKEVKGSLGGLKSVVGSLGAAIAGAFSVMAIVKFATESVKAANQLSDALTGLKSILDGQGRSFSDAQKFLEEYTADGLVPMANAITAYKNLASRGYDDTQIKQTLVALKDASAFGRQASYSMGEAVESATEGLKNENSVLVDNAGVTKNVAKMWEEYAASIGTTANNLTQQQKIQAEVNGILTESRFQAGDAAKVAGTLSGQLAQLSVNFTNLKVAVGNALKPIVQSLLPVINVAIATLTRFANALASVVSVLFGNATSGTVEATQQVADGYNSAAEGAENLAKSTKEAGKAAKKYLAGFDELTKIGDSSGGGGSSSATAGGTTSVSVPVTADANMQDNISPKVQAVVDRIKEMFQSLGAWFVTAYQPAIGAWGDAFGSLGPAVEKTGSRISTAWKKLQKKTLAPFGSYIVKEFVPDIANTFTTTFVPIFTDVAHAALEIYATDFENVALLVEEYCGHLRAAFDGVKTVFSDMCASITSNWNEYGGNLLQGFIDFRESLWEIWWNIYDNIIDPVITAVGDKLGWLWDAHLKPLWDSIVEFVLSVGENILALWNGFLQPIIDWVISVLAPAVTNVVTIIVDTVAIAIGFIADVISSILTFLDGLIQFIVGIFTLDWDKAWNGVVKVFESIFGLIGGIVKGVVNDAIWIFNALISAIYSVVAGIVNGLGGIVEAAGDLIGKDWGFSMPSAAPQIPYLAKGAVLPANKPFLAMVGDQKHGTNVEAPLATIQEAVALVMDDYAAANLAGQEAILSVLKDILEAVLGIEIGDDVIGQAVARYNRKVAVMRGGA